MTISARNLNADNVAVVNRLNGDRIIRENVGADFRGIMHPVPKFLNELFGVWNSDVFDLPLGTFFRAEDDEPAVGVRESGVGFPDALGHTAFGAFCFQLAILAQCFHGGVSHVAPSHR